MKLNDIFEAKITPQPGKWYTVVASNLHILKGPYNSEREADEALIRGRTSYARRVLPGDKLLKHQQAGAPK